MMFRYLILSLCLPLFVYGQQSNEESCDIVESCVDNWACCDQRTSVDNWACCDQRASVDNWACCDQWTSWVRVNGEGSTDQDFTRIEAELFLPLWQCSDSTIIFTDIRGAKYNRKHLLDASGGLGIRQVLGDCVIAGVNVFYDGLLTRENHWFNYIDVGGEFFTSCFDFRLNGRIPLGRTKRAFGSGPTVINTFLRDDEVRLNTRLQGKEKSEWTLDGELGWRFKPLSCCDWRGRLYAGGQYVNDADRRVETNAALFGIEFYNNELHFSSCGFQVTLGARVSTNFSKHTDGIFYLTFRKATGTSRLSCCDCNALLLSRMDDPVIRRYHPGNVKRKGKVIEEPLTTVEYPVDGIWVSYEADFDNLQTQINKALANGGPNTMIFADGSYDVPDSFLNPQQVLAGGNAFLDSRGKISGAPVPWGAWGNFTTTPALITSTDNSQDLLVMGNRSSVDTVTVQGGFNGIINNPGATDLTIRKATVIAANDDATPRFGIALIGSDNSLIEATNILGGPFDRGGYSIISSDGVCLRNISSSNAGDDTQAGLGNIISLSSNTLIDGMFSNDDGGNSWTIINSDRTTMRNFIIISTDFDGISSGFVSALGGSAPSNTHISNGLITGSTSDAIFFGTNNGFNSISNMVIEGYESNGIQIGGAGTSPTAFTGITSNMAISNVHITSLNGANNNAGILIQNRVVNGVETVSVNGATIVGAGGSNDGFEIRSEELTSVINLSGQNNTTSNVDEDCLLLPDPSVGTINGGIEHDGGACCGDSCTP